MDATDKTAPPQGIAFDLMVHRIHTGENLKADKKSYTIMGFGGSHNDFTDVRYPAMSPQGSPGDTRNCSVCHVKNSEQNLPTGLNAVMDPQGPINPEQPVTAACAACHVKIPTASHALANTHDAGGKLRGLPRTKRRVQRWQSTRAILGGLSRRQGSLKAQGLPLRGVPGHCVCSVGHKPAPSLES